jgi:hypothetical protein
MQMMKGANNTPKIRTVAGSYLVVLLAAGALYVGTCAPGPVWQDSGMIQYRVWHNDIEGRLGLALSHPLFYIIAIGAKYVPLGEFGYRVNVTGAVISAVAAANLFLLLRLWLGGTYAAIIGSASLALSHTFWRHATIPETYNLYIALLLLELIVLLEYVRSNRVGYLYALGFLNGLAIADHMLASIGFVCYAVFLAVLLSRKRISVKSFAIVAALWMVGALPYEYLVIKELIRTGDLAVTLGSACFGMAYRDDVLNVMLSGRIIKENVCWMALNFPTPNVLLFFLGLFVVRKLSPGRAFANIVLALLILFFVFAFRYTIVDRYAFFIPFYCVVSILIGVGAYKLVELRKYKGLAFVLIILTLLPIPAYVAAPKIAKRSGFTSGRNRKVPYRDDYKYFLQPWRQGYRGPEEFADEVFSTVEHNGIVHGDSTTVFALLYAQEVRLQREDIKIVSAIASSENSPEFSAETIDRLLAARPVYVVSRLLGYCPPFLLENYDFAEAGIVWKVVGRKEDKEKFGLCPGIGRQVSSGTGGFDLRQ